MSCDDGPRGARRLRAGRARARGARGGRGASRHLPGVRRRASRGSPGCPSCSRHAEGLVIPPAPPAVEERLLDRIARERGRRRRRRRALLAPARAARSRSLPSPACWSARARPRSPSEPATRGRGEAAHHDLRYRRPRRLGARRAVTRAAAAPRSTSWVKGLQPGGSGLRGSLRAAGWSASAGTFRADARGRALRRVLTAARRARAVSASFGAHGPTASARADRRGRPTGRGVAVRGPAELRNVRR